MAKIVGGSASTTMPVPDWNQTNPKRADYIKNKPFEKVDNELSTTSTNPAQNKVVTAKFNEVNNGVQTALERANLASNTANAAQQTANAAGQEASVAKQQTANLADRVTTLENQVGDIDTALDAIIAMQQDLIGG